MQTSGRPQSVNLAASSLRAQSVLDWGSWAFPITSSLSMTSDEGSAVVENLRGEMATLKEVLVASHTTREVAEDTLNKVTETN
jgi:hypothetical protein